MNIENPFVMRNLVYGVEDSLISTTGVVVGVSLSGLARREVLVTGLILVMVEALSMSFGAFVSEDAYMETAEIPRTTKEVSKYALIMFVSYVLAGLVPLLPFIIDLPGAWRYSLGLALLALFALVYGVQKNIKKASILTGIGGLILGASVVAGRALKN